MRESRKGGERYYNRIMIRGANGVEDRDFRTVFLWDESRVNC